VPGDDHSSGPSVTGGIKRPTRRSSSRGISFPPYSALLRVGLAWLQESLLEPVSSYLAISPLPGGQAGQTSVGSSRRDSSQPPTSGRYLFCGAFRRSLDLRVTKHPAPRSSDFPPLGRNQEAIAWDRLMTYFTRIFCDTTLNLYACYGLITRYINIT